MGQNLPAYEISAPDNNFLPNAVVAFANENWVVELRDSANYDNAQSDTGNDSTNR